MISLPIDLIPCVHCGRQEKRHRTFHDFRREQDEKVKPGYLLPLTQCPGFIAREDERRNKIDLYLGDEFRQHFKSPEPGVSFAWLDTLSPPAEPLPPIRPSTEIGLLMRKQQNQ